MKVNPPSMSNASFCCSFKNSTILLFYIRLDESASHFVGEFLSFLNFFYMMKRIDGVSDVEFNTQNQNPCHNKRRRKGDVLNENN